jgi:Predicted metal-dependent enzyme
MLARKYADKNLAGHSNPTGFFLFGDMSTEDIRTAVNEAMSRLRAGESDLAIHPGCGTNLATSMVLPMTFASVPFQGTRSNRRLLLLPVALMFAVLGYVLSKPLGPWLQRNVTTEADLGNLQVQEIIPIRNGVHRIITK